MLCAVHLQRLLDGHAIVDFKAPRQSSGFETAIKETWQRITEFWNDSMRAREKAERERLAASRKALESELKVATQSWMLPVVFATYKQNPEGNLLFAEESKVLAGHEYSAAPAGVDQGHVHVGRLLATGGLSVLAGRGGVRSDETFSISYTLNEQPRD